MHRKVGSFQQRLNSVTEWRAYLTRYVLQSFTATTDDEQEILFASQKRAALLHSKDNNKNVRMAPMEERDIAAFSKCLAGYAMGGQSLTPAVLAEIQGLCGPLVSGDIRTSADACLRLLEGIKFLRPGDNLYRVRAEKQLKQGNGSDDLAKGCAKIIDPFDPIRELVERPVYAIDSISTSEVDDAIGYHVDPTTNIEWITVYVADATAFCHLDSSLDCATGRLLATTTYLPEKVFFMLPKELVQAATLAPDRPCRTFHATFRFDETGSVAPDYSVGVSNCTMVRRITYNVCQDIINSPASPDPPPSAPSWMTQSDVQTIRSLNTLRNKRREWRTRDGAWKLLSPKPSMVVDLSLDTDIKITLKAHEDIPLRGAYNLVEEMMVAANEVCAKVALDANTIIPFRVTRPLSHRSAGEAGEDSVSPLPPGVVESMLQHGHVNEDVHLMSRTIADDNQLLRGVTRAYYSHQQGRHTFLNTSFYCHATSPLRRYADMVVHHQLKAVIGAKAGLARSGGYEQLELITMREKCQKISKLCDFSKKLQLKSMYFWALRYIREEMKGGARTLQAVVAYNYASDASVALSFSGKPFVARVVLSRVLLTATLYHDDVTVGKGDVLDLDVEEVCPVRLVLRLRLKPRTDSSSPRRTISLDTFGNALFTDV